jgi:hypothetical protein
MPPRISACINEQWELLDPDAKHMIDALRSKPGFMQFSHAREVFKDHLLGTWALLETWGQPRDVARAGLFHTGYSGDIFQFFFWNAADSLQRQELREIVGVDAEQLIWLFGTLHRGKIFGLESLLGNGNGKDIDDAAGHALDTSLVIPHRLTGNYTLADKMAAKIVVVTLADYLDQMVENNGWRDHHQVESPLSLYPGDMRPAVCLVVECYLKFGSAFFTLCNNMYVYAMHPNQLPVLDLGHVQVIPTHQHL